MLLNREKLINSIISCGVDPTAEITEMYNTFAEMMIDFNKRINITRITDPDDIIVKHIEDSLALYRFADIVRGANYLDIGTGGGVPALPLLIARQDIKGVLIDSVGKKIRFAESVINEFGLSAKTIHIRAEELGKNDGYKSSFDLITARAVTKFEILIGYAAPLLSPGGMFAAYKGEISEEEYNKGCKAAEKTGLKAPEKTEYELTNGDKRTLIFVKK
ncbi:MAG: 16S rRNA (guanine(527)-N(7))-methyltransferase RsmG [Clostridia bacterium]|nr:16S rRNA (guanine(527)-N(7))-methyltransferase RsmG [Clostridia bacterium]